MTDTTHPAIDVARAADLQLRVSVTNDDTVSVWVGGEVDASHAKEICSVVTSVSELDEVRRVVVDLSGVEFMDSSGLSALIRCKQSLQATSQDFEVVGAQGATLKLLEMTATLDYLAGADAQSV